MYDSEFHDESITLRKRTAKWTAVDKVGGYVAMGNCEPDVYHTGLQTSSAYHRRSMLSIIND